MSVERKGSRQRRSISATNVLRAGVAVAAVYLGAALYDSIEKPSASAPDFELGIGIVIFKGDTLFMECGNIADLYKEEETPPRQTSSLTTFEKRYKNNVTRISGKVDGEEISTAAITDHAVSLVSSKFFVENLPVEKGLHTAECEIELENGVIQTVSGDFSVQ